MRSFALPSSLAIITLALLLPGCPGRLTDPERFGVGISRPDAGGPSGDGGGEIDVPAMLAAECAGAGCHGASSPAFGLDLVSPGLEERLMDATSATCMGRPMVDPADPDASLLLEKVVEAPHAGVARMPYMQEPLTTAQQDALRAWIAGL